MRQEINDSRKSTSIRWLLAAAFVAGSAGGGCMVDDKEMDPEAVGDVEQEVSIVSFYPMGSATAFDSSPGWGPENLTDGDLNSVYSSLSRSASSTSSGDEPYVQAFLASAPQMVDRIRLHARMDSGNPLAFPQEYRVHLTNSDNTGWDFVGTYTKQPVAGEVTLSVPPHNTHGIWIEASILGQDDYGTYFFQLAEIELGRYNDLDGLRVAAPGSPVFLIDAGKKRPFPDAATYDNLFRDWNGIIDYIDIDSIPTGTAISSGAVLAQASGTGAYLIDQGVKRGIASPETMDRYHFDEAKINVVAPIIIQSIPDDPDHPVIVWP